MVATRPSEMRTATWDEFDIEEGIWTIKASRMKNRKIHMIPLPKQAIEKIQQLKEITGYSEYLLPSLSKHQPLSEGTANKAIRTIWPEYTVNPHGFRHLFSTLANEKHHNMADIIEVALSHKIQGKIRATYNKATHDKKRLKIIQWYADYLEGLKEGRIKENIEIKSSGD